MSWLVNPSNFPVPKEIKEQMQNPKPHTWYTESGSLSQCFCPLQSLNKSAFALFFFSVLGLNSFISGGKNPIFVSGNWRHRRDSSFVAGKMGFEEQKEELVFLLRIRLGTYRGKFLPVSWGEQTLVPWDCRVLGKICYIFLTWFWAFLWLYLFF